MLDFVKTFKKYEALVYGVDKSVRQIQESHPDCLRCTKHCSDCCFAVFDLSLIESVYLNVHFYSFLAKEKQGVVLERAERADRAYYKIKRKFQKMVDQQEKKEEEIFRLLAEERVHCPLLNEEGLCDFYEHRPIICRAYGVPTAIQGMGHTCGKSGFKKGTLYPTINLDRINERLLKLSEELLAEIGSKDRQLQMRLLPVSTSLLSSYDEEFFGMPA